MNEPDDKSRAEREQYERVYGLSAALALFDRRPESVVSIAHTKEVRLHVGDMLREAARRKIAYREVDDVSLGNMAKSVHHEGVCLLVRPLPEPGPKRIVESLADQGLLVALDGVENPHNVGAILRSAAYFGAKAMLIEAAADKQALTPAARRVAEGGAELVPVARVPVLADALRMLAEQGIVIIGADAHGKLSSSDMRWPKRVALVMGHEGQGLSDEVRAACSMLVRIPGTGAIDSLNVSVASGILLASYAAMHGFGRAQ